MAYSRWSSSRWYTFWNNDKKVFAKENELFTICELDGDIDFTYKEIATNKHECLIKVTKKLECTEDEINELKTYMKRFKMDVDDEYRRN